MATRCKRGTRKYGSVRKGIPKKCYSYSDLYDFGVDGSLPLRGLRKMLRERRKRLGKSKKSKKTKKSKKSKRSRSKK
jgi:hypothetical protein